MLTANMGNFAACHFRIWQLCVCVCCVLWCSVCVCVKPIVLAIKCVSMVEWKNTKWRHLRTNVQENILTLERDGTCTVNGAVRSAHKITKSVGQIPSWEANRSSANQEIPRILSTRSFISALTGACHLSLSSARSVQSRPSNTTSWGSILISIYA